VVDTLVLMSTLLNRSLRYVGWSAYKNVYGGVFIVFYPMMYCVRLVDNWLIVLLTVDRYIAVCHPLKIHARRGTARTWMIIGVMTVVSVLFSLPRCFEYKLVDITVQGDAVNASVKFVPTAPLMQNRVYVFFYRTSLCFVLLHKYLLTN